MPTFVLTYTIPGSPKRGLPPEGWRGQLDAPTPEAALREIRIRRPYRYGYTALLAPSQNYRRPDLPSDRTPIAAALVRIKLGTCRHCKREIVRAEDAGWRWHCLDPLPLGGPSGEINTYARHICRQPTGETT